MKARTSSVDRRRDWQGYEINVPRDEQCRRRSPIAASMYCERAKGHTGNHKAGHIQWGQSI